MGKSRDDHELVKRCVRREPGAWVEFVDRFKGTVQALARRLMKILGHLPDEPELALLCETAEQSRIASRIVWPAVAALRGEGPSNFDELAMVESWFEDLGPVFPRG